MDIAVETRNLTSKKYSDVTKREQFEVEIKYLQDSLLKSCLRACQSVSQGPWIHLLEICNLCASFQHLLVRSRDVVDCLLKTYRHCQVSFADDCLNIMQTLRAIFPTVEFATSTLFIKAQYSSGLKSQVSTKFKSTRKQTYKNDELFKFKELKARVYRPQPVNLLDIQLALPQVMRDVMKLDCTWSKALGLTLSSVSTDIPQTIQCQQNLPASPEPNEKSLLNCSQKLNEKPPLKSGRDVAEFLIQESMQTDKVTIWYLNFAPSVTYRPYDLVVASKATASEEHVVISVFGVLYVRKKGNSELLSLGEWYIEAVSFDSIRHISYFHNFRKIKALKIWRYLARHNKFCKFQCHLENQHLFIVPAVPKTVLYVKDLICQMQSMSFFPQKLTKQSYVEFEQKLLGQVFFCNRNLDRLYALCQSSVESCIEDCEKYYNYCNAQLNVETIAKKMSMSVEKRKKEKQTHNFKRAEENVAKMITFKHLILQMIRSSLMLQIVDQFVAFCRKILECRESVFLVTFEIGKNNVHLTSAPDTLYEKFLSMVKNSLNELNILPNISENEAEEGDFTDNFFQQIEGCGILKEMKMCLDREGQELCEIQTRFTWLKEVTAFLKLLHEKQKVSLKLKVSELERDFMQAQTWLKQVSTIPDLVSTEFGLFCVSFEQVHRELTQELESSFQDNLGFIVNDTRFKISIVTQDLEERIFQLETTPVLEGSAFTAYFVSLQQMEGEVAAFDRKIEHLKTLFEMLKLFNFNGQSEDEEAQKNMCVMWGKFTFALEKAIEFIKIHSPEVKSELETEYKKLLKKGIEIAAQTCTERYTTPGHDTPANIVSEIKRLHSTFENVYKKIQALGRSFDTITNDEMKMRTHRRRSSITPRYFNNNLSLETGTALVSIPESSTLEEEETSGTASGEGSEITSHVDDVSTERTTEATTSESTAPETIYNENDSAMKDTSSANENKTPPVTDSLTTTTETLPEIFSSINKTLDTVASTIGSPTLHRTYERERMLVEEGKRAMSVCYELWCFLQLTEASIVAWKQFQVNKLDIPRVFEKLERWKQDFKKVCPDVSHEDRIFQAWTKTLSHFTNLLSVVQNLLNTPLRDNHWHEIFVILGGVYDQTTTYTIHEFLAFDLIYNETKLEQICQTACAEKALETCFLHLTADWSKAEFVFTKLKITSPKDRKRSRKEEIMLLKSRHEQHMYVLVGIDDLCAKLEDSLVTLQSMLVSPYICSLSSTVAHWNTQLQDLREILDLWSTAQQEWTYLLQTFKNDEVQLKYGAEFAIFNEVSQTYRSFVNSVREEMLVMTVSKPGKKFGASSEPAKVLLSIVIRKQSSLIKSLEEYAQKACQSFPRFALLSNTAVLSAFAHSTHPKTLQPAVGLCFHGVRGLTFAEVPVSHHEIVANPSEFSAVGDYVTLQITGIRGDFEDTNLFETPINFNLPVDVCFNKIEQGMVNIVKRNITECYAYLIACQKPNGLIETMAKSKFNYQSLTVSFDILLSNEKLFQKHTSTYISQLSELVKLCTCGKMLFYQTLLLKTLYYRDIQGAKQHNFTKDQEATSINYKINICEETLDTSISVGCGDVELTYGFEYNNNMEKFLCITPLTSQYLYACVNALRHVQVGCLQGSPHTGKSTLLRQLARMLGRHMEVLSCTAATPLNCCTQLLHGAMHAKTLLCFENLHRLPSAVMSVLGQHFSHIFQKLQKTHADDIYRNCFGILATLPYQDCTPISTNLKESLRVTSVTKVHEERILETHLLLHGISTTLSHKLYFLHAFDKIPLKVLLEAIDKSHRHHQSSATEEERTKALWKSMQEVLRHSHVAHLQNIVGGEEKRSKESQLIASVHDQMRADNLQPKPNFVNKVFELHEALQTSNSIILYGKTFSGKTACYETLARSLCQFYSPWFPTNTNATATAPGCSKFSRVSVDVIYPNMFSYSELFGDFNDDSSREGLFIKLLRHSTTLQPCQTTQQIQRWLVVDGNLNDDWLIPLHSLVEPPNYFVLANKSKILCTGDTKLLFETDSLGQTSPSFLSHCKLFHFEANQTVDWHCLYESWRTTSSNKYFVQKDGFDVILDVLDYTLVKTVTFMRTRCVSVFTDRIYAQKLDPFRTCVNAECTYVLNTLSALLAVWKSRSKHGGDQLPATPKFLCQALAYAFSISLAPLVKQCSLDSLDVFVRQLFSTVPHSPVVFPDHIIQCCFHPREMLMRWRENKHMLSFTPPPNYVVTHQHEQYYHTLDMLTNEKVHTLIIGKIGSGKTALVKYMLSLKHDVWRYQLSAATTNRHLQKDLIRKVGGYRRSVFFLDDLNLAPGSSKTKHSLECLREILSKGGFYDVEEMYFRHLPTMHFIGTHTTPAMHLSPRLLRHFQPLQIWPLEDKQMLTFFSKQPCFKPFNAELPILSKVISKTTLEIHKEICSLPPSHLIFSQHHLIMVFKGLAFFRPVDIESTFNEERRLSPANRKRRGKEKQLTNVAEVLTYTPPVGGQHLKVAEVLAEFVRVWVHQLMRVYVTPHHNYQRAEVERVLKQHICHEWNEQQFSEYFLPAELHSRREFLLVQVHSNNNKFHERVVHSEFKQQIQQVAPHAFIVHQQLMQHVAILSNILNFIGGHALLISRNGHGKSQNAKIVAKLNEAEFFELTSEKTLHQNDIIKQAFNMAAFSNKQVLLYASEMVGEKILNQLSAILLDGSCPDIYEENELQTLCSQQLPGSKINNNNSNISVECQRKAEGKFNKRVKVNLHLVIAVNDSHLQHTLNRYPMLLHKVACIDIYNEWSLETLEEVATEWLLRQQDLSVETVPIIARHLATVHVTAKYYARGTPLGGKDLFSPLKFFEFIEMFSDIYQWRAKLLKEQLNFLKRAFARLDEVNQSIAAIATRIQNSRALHTELTQAVSEANKSMRTAQNNYLDTKHRCEKQEAEVKELNAPVLLLKQALEEEFRKLSPIYDSALKAIEHLEKHTLDELRTYFAPPEGVKFVLDTLCVMFDLKPSFHTAKLLLMQRTFFKDLLSYDKDHVTDKVDRQLKIFADTQKKYELEKVSLAAAQLRTWMLAIYNYNLVLRQIKPNRDKLHREEQHIKKIEHRLSQNKKHCQSVKNELERHIQEYKTRVEDLRKFNEKKEELLGTKSDSESLLSKMKIFTDDWHRKRTSCTSQTSANISDAMLSAARVVYASALCCKQRHNLQRKLNALFNNKNKDESTTLLPSSTLPLAEILTSNEERHHWDLNALSETSRENVLCARAVALLGGRCLPLLIESEPGQSEKIVRLCENKEHLKDSVFEGQLQEKDIDEIEITSVDSENLDEVLSLAMREGQTVLVKNLQRSFSSDRLQKLVDRQFTCTQTRSNDMLSCHPNFRLYLSASVTNSYFDQENFVLPLHRTIPVNLCSRDVESENEFFKTVSSNEKADLASRETRLYLETKKIEQQQIKIQHTLLERVVGLEKKLSDNLHTDLISLQDHLINLQNVHVDAKAGLKFVKKTTSVFRSLAHFAHLVFTCATRLTCNQPPLNHHLSSEWGRSVLHHTLAASEATKHFVVDTQERVSQLKSLLLLNCFQKLRLTIPNENLLLLPLTAHLEQMKSSGEISSTECMLFTNNYNQVNPNVTFSTPKPEWIPQQVWKRLDLLQKSSPRFKKLLQSIQQSSQGWREYFSTRCWSDTPHFYNVRSKFYLALLWLAYDKTLLLKLSRDLVLSAFGPDLTMFDEARGFDHVTSLPSKYNILSHSSHFDPIKIMMDSTSTHCDYAAMGNHHQVTTATKLLVEAVENNTWLIIYNCHLIRDWPKSFVSTLESTLESFQAKQDSTFRLWMTYTVDGGCSDQPLDGGLPDFIQKNCCIFSLPCQQKKSDKDSLLSFSETLRKIYFSGDVIKSYDSSIVESVFVRLKTTSENFKPIRSSQVSQVTECFELEVHLLKATLKQCTQDASLLLTSLESSDVTDAQGVLYDALVNNSTPSSWAAKEEDLETFLKVLKERAQAHTNVVEDFEGGRLVANISLFEEPARLIAAIIHVKGWKSCVAKIHVPTENYPPDRVFFTHVKMKSNDVIKHVTLELVTLPTDEETIPVHTRCLQSIIFFVQKCDVIPTNALMFI